MRVTGGTARDTPLRSPRRPGVRPTMDRVRSALFNILAPLGVEDATVVDMFAGTGSLGIEALSRGAAHVDFVEASTEQCADIEANLVAAKVGDRATVHSLTVQRSLEVLLQPYDIVLMDPPYADPFPTEVVAQLEARGLLNPNAVVVVGHASRVPSPDRCGGMARWQDRRYGDSSLAFYSRSAPESAT